MSQTICPRCQQRIIFDPHTNDINHECNSGNATTDEEDVVVIGSWEDWTGSGDGLNAFTQGIENELFGTRAGIEGADDEEKTDRGKKASTRRQRQHIEFIKLKGGD